MEVFQILAVVVMIASAVWLKRREKQTKHVRTPKRQLSAHPDAHPAAVPPAVPLEMKTSKRKNTVRKPGAQVPPSSPAPATDNKQEGPISLRTVEEARRAFIYSEIFSRKYE